MKRGVKKYPSLEASGVMKVQQAVQLGDDKDSGDEVGALSKTGNLADA